MNLVRVLGRFAGPRVAPGERCELCGLLLADRHGHVVELERHTLLCVCPACAVLFGNHARYRAVPGRVLTDESFGLTEADWAALQIPIGMAFLIQRSGRWLAYFPSPAGPVEAEPPAEVWRRIASSSALVRAVEPEVEALLLYRPRGGALRSLLVPIDTCYELCALIRLHWKGFDGGEAARRAIDGFFADLQARSRSLSPTRRTA
jgi:hypothetical protein